MSAVKPEEILRVGALLGEGILWDARRQRLWWTDIHGKRLHRYDWAARKLSALEAPDRIGSFGFIAGSEALIAAFAPGIARYDPATGAVTWLAHPQEDMSGLRFNDGRVDRAGRFWSGTMVEDGPRARRACLYSMDRANGLRCHVRDVRISNGLCLSPDGRILYFADSPTRTIWAYELAEPGGTLSKQRVFARTPEGAYPDGATVDADGCVWSAHWGASCVVRYTPGGAVDRTVPVPTSQPSCVCFAGPNLDVLCVTSARSELSPEVLRAEPHAGDVFLFHAGAQGLPEPEYQA
jgi:sugar lactone lactonase YvrE